MKEEVTFDFSLWPWNMRGGGPWLRLLAYSQFKVNADKKKKKEEKKMAHSLSLFSSSWHCLTASLVICMLTTTLIHLCLRFSFLAITMHHFPSYYYYYFSPFYLAFIKLKSFDHITLCFFIIYNKNTTFCLSFQCVGFFIQSEHILLWQAFSFLVNQISALEVHK